MADVEKITPYAVEGDKRAKSEQIRDMFNSIAPAYDLMNRMMSFGIDATWRRKCVRAVSADNPSRILDVATGTGDFAIDLASANLQASITGVDLSEGMISVGRRKIDERNLSNRIELKVADALDLPFEDNCFDAVTIAFGVRNFENLVKGYAEMARVLRPGGKLIVLELTEPSSWIVKPFYKFYTRCIIPLVGRMVSKDARAYTYLPRSIAAVPARKDMTDLMEKAGLTQSRWKNMTLGVATFYEAVKPIHVP